MQNPHQQKVQQQIKPIASNVSVLKQPGNTASIALLEKLLKMAEAGEIQGVSGVIIRSDRTINNFCDGECCSKSGIAATITGIHSLLKKLTGGL